MMSKFNYKSLDATPTGAVMWITSPKPAKKPNFIEVLDGKFAGMEISGVKVARIKTIGNKQVSVFNATGNKNDRVFLPYITDGAKIDLPMGYSIDYCNIGEHVTDQNAISFEVSKRKTITGKCEMRVLQNQSKIIRAHVSRQDYVAHQTNLDFTLKTTVKDIHETHNASDRRKLQEKYEPLQTREKDTGVMIDLG